VSGLDLLRRRTPATADGGALDFDWRQYVLYIGFAGLFVFFAVTLGDKGFTSSDNLLNIVRQTATISVMAVAVTFVIGAAEIDLSVGAVAGLSSVLTAMAIDSFGVVGGICTGLLVGLAVGSVNGALVTWVGIPSFLVTLGMLGIAAGRRSGSRTPRRSRSSRTATTRSSARATWAPCHRL
jgi:ribose transport system permease protein